MLEENTCKQSKAINFLSKNTVLLLILLGVSVAFWVLAIVAYKIFGFFVDANNIVLTFVGIITTFIVISHYTQINNIERKVDEKLSLINKINLEVKILEESIMKVQERIQYIKNDIAENQDRIESLINRTDKENLEQNKQNTNILSELSKQQGIWETMKDMQGGTTALTKAIQGCTATMKAVQNLIAPMNTMQQKLGITPNIEQTDDPPAS